MKDVKIYIRLLSAVLGIIITLHTQAQNNDGLELYTPYTKVSVSPGKTVQYSIDIINNGSTTRNENISISNLSRLWKYSLTADGYNLKKLAVLPGEKQNVKLKVDVPYAVRKGNYTFYAKLGEGIRLPLIINVSEAGSSETELSCEQKNMEGTAKSNFSFKVTLTNQTPERQQYALMANAPRGWNVAIKPNYKQATSTEVEANETKDITYDIKPPGTVEAGTYKIPIKVVSGSTSASLELEVVITGSYDMALTTPNGLLSTQMTAGDEKRIQLELTNTGSAPLENITLKASSPRNWEVIFDTDTLKKLEPGKTKSLIATLKAAKKAIPGDYITKISARTPETESEISFRVMVKTPLLMGWIGILVIALALGLVFYLFKKYGRR